MGAFTPLVVFLSLVIHAICRLLFAARMAYGPMVEFRCVGPISWGSRLCLRARLIWPYWAAGRWRHLSMAIVGENVSPPCLLAFCVLGQS